MGEGKQPKVLLSLFEAFWVEMIPAHAVRVPLKPGVSAGFRGTRRQALFGYQWIKVMGASRLGTLRRGPTHTWLKRKEASKQRWLISVCLRSKRAQ